MRAALRRRKPEKRLRSLARRPSSAFPEISTVAAEPRPRLLLDTGVYLLDAANRLPREVTDLLDRASLYHCAVCLSEIALGLANADPSHPRWRASRDHFLAVVEAIPASRLVTPDRAMWADAGIIAGILARIQGYQPWQRKECLNDALVYLCAAKLGAPVLTTDRADFDLIQQIAPEGRILAFAAAA